MVVVMFLPRGNKRERSGEFKRDNERVWGRGQGFGGYKRARGSFVISQLKVI